MQHLIEQTRSKSCPPQEFISDLPVCVKMDEENTHFFEKMTVAEGESEDASQEMDEDDEFDDGSVLKTYKEILERMSANFWKTKDME